MHHDCYEEGRGWKRAAKMAARQAMAGGWHGPRWAGRWGGGPFGAFGPFGPGGPFGPFGPQGPGGPGGPWSPGGKRRPGRGRMFGRDQLRWLLLQLIAEAPRHGYDLIKAIEERSGGHYSPSPGVVYPTLAMLADEGLIAEQDSEDQRRKFAVTEAGTAALQEAADEAEQAMKRLTHLGEHAERHRAPSIERAAMNLFTAVGQRMRDAVADDEDGDDLPHRIAAILDEAAQKIERL